jgi:hypothetical protein
MKTAAIWNKFYSFCYERFLGIQTTGYSAPPVKHSGHYTPLPYSVLQHILDKMQLGSEDVFVDIGCGKGRVICCASRLSLQKIIGIELNKELVAMAEANIQKIRRPKSRVEIINVSADEYDYTDATAIYLYNPFEAPIMDKVLSQFASSLKRNPRNLKIAYANPLQEQLFKQTGWLKKTDEWPARKYFGFDSPISFWST